MIAFVSPAPGVDNVLGQNWMTSESSWLVTQIAPLVSNAMPFKLESSASFVKIAVAGTCPPALSSWFGDKRSTAGLAALDVQSPSWELVSIADGCDGYAEDES
jgi:hypothetical protein